MNSVPFPLFVNNRFDYKQCCVFEKILDNYLQHFLNEKLCKIEYCQNTFEHFFYTIKHFSFYGIPDGDGQYIDYFDILETHSECPRYILDYYRNPSSWNILMFEFVRSHVGLEEIRYPKLANSKTNRMIDNVKSNFIRLFSTIVSETQQDANFRQIYRYYHFYSSMNR